MPGADLQRANKAAKDAGVDWPRGKKPFHDWLERNYRWEKEGQSYTWLRRKAEEFLRNNPKYRA